MQPGDTRNLRFTARITRSVLANSESLLILRPQFASIPAFQLLPVIGFQREFVLRDPARRARFGLPPMKIVPPSRLGTSESGLAAHQARFETVITVPRGHHGVARLEEPKPELQLQIPLSFCLFCLKKK